LMGVGLGGVIAQFSWSRTVSLWRFCLDRCGWWGQMVSFLWKCINGIANEVWFFKYCGVR
jgi:hypothetical protein